ncbi:EsaB/YukD family protein [Streptococcus pluranimalium]|uniref:Secretion accessory protein EsaB/YukD n=1 Tax=Streptococcus pluranimalium TaxID=82348 RepID=A0A2L0D3D1_9STRE|nr:EsaB/YukD family protein [Streptococcus pluranimalium]AUW96342.1 secretion accessory protein EsaB/YukD [Streptococcus pluranimalium]
METHINVTVYMADQKQDVRIPRKIETKQLIKELDNIFAYPKDRLKYQLKVINKGLLLDEGDVLADFPITTGDQLKIEEGSV